MTRATVVLDGEVGPLRQKLRQAAQDINAFGRDGSAAMGDMLGPAQALQARMAGIAATITSGAFAVFVKSAIDAQDAMDEAAQRAGVTTEQFSAMAYAARFGAVETDQLGKAYTKLNGLLADAQAGQKQAVQTFRDLRLDPKAFADADQLLLALAERFETLPDGVDKTALAVAAFGEKLGPGMVPLLNKGKAGLEELREEAQRLGLVVSGEAGRAAGDFNDQLDRLGGVAQGTGMRIAQQLTPVLATLAGELVKVGGDFGIADVAARGIRTTLEALAVVGANTAFVFRSVGREMGAWGAQIGLAIEVLRAPPGELIATARKNWGQWSAISDAVRADGERARAELDEFERRILRVGEFSDANRRSEDRGFTPGPAGTGGGNRRTAPSQPAGAKPGGDADRSYMATYEAVLAEEQRVASIIDQGREFGKARELAYWRFILDTATLSSADRMAILRKTSALEVQLAQSTARDRQAADAEVAAQAEAMALGKLDAERAAAKLAADLGEITRAQLLQLEAGFEDQRFEIQRQALQRRMQLQAQDPDTSPAERERLYTRLLELERQYQARRAEIGGQMSKGDKGFNFFTDIEAQLTNAFSGILGSAGTFFDRLRQLAQGAGNALINELAVKPLAAWLAAQVRMLAMKMGFIAKEQVMDTAASGAKVAIKAGETGAIVAANAAQAGTGAAASQAAIPVVGPALALAAMAAIFAAVMSMGSSRKSAAGGYDIPRGLNPVTQLHEEEMVLPKHLANAVRNMAAGQQDAAPYAEGPAPKIEVRGASVGDFLMMHRNELHRAMQQAWKDRPGSRR